MTEQFLLERNLIPHDIITDTRQFITKRFSCEARISLNNFSIIVSSESFRTILFLLFIRSFCFTEEGEDQRLYTKGI